MRRYSKVFKMRNSCLHYQMKSFDYLQFQMDQAQQNQSNSIEEQKEQEMEPETPKRSVNPQPILEAENQEIRNEDNESLMEEQKQNQPQDPIQNEEEAILNEDDQVEVQEAEQPIGQNANPAVEEQQQLVGEVEEAQQMSPSIEREVENQVQVQVEQQKQEIQQGEAQQEPQQEQQQQQGQVQQAIQQNQAPIEVQNQQGQLEEGQEVEQNVVSVPHQQANSPNTVNYQNQYFQAQMMQKQKQVEDSNIKLYLHKLERQVQAAIVEKNAFKQELTSLKEAQSKLRQEFQTSKQNTMDLRKKKLEAQIERTKANKESDKLKKENQVYRKKIEEIEKIGDIIVLKNTLQELNVLVEAQKQEIDQLKSVNSQPLIENLKQSLTVISRYEYTQKIHETEIQKLNAQNKMLVQENNKQSDELISSRKEIERLKQRQFQLDCQILTLNNTITGWQTKWNELQADRESNTKTKQLQKKINDYESQRNIGHQSELIHLNVLSDREEKDIILREYLILQGKYKQQLYEFQQAKTKLKKLQKEQSRVYANYIRKKEYIDLSVKYNKAKKCLQGAFQQLRLIRNDESQNQNVAQEVNELLQGTQARQCQKLIKNTQNIVSSLHDKIDSLESKQNTSLSVRENQHLQLLINDLKKQQANNQRLLKLMNEDITLKNRLITEKNQIIGTLRKRALLVPNQAQNYKTTLKLENDVASLKETISIFETQNILLVKQISALNSQLAHWKLLYNKIKQNLTEKISSSLESMGTNGAVRVVGEETISICRECEERKLLISSKQLESIQTQTDNLNEFYYKQIKEILAYLNKVSKECQKIPHLSKELNQNLHEIRQKFVTEFKEKYLRVQANYNGKLNQLRREKADNEAWRVRAKEQIREEFQDIRELVINNRLANALRQAKNLIDYLQAEAYKQDDENQAEEIEEENPNPVEEGKNQ